MLEIRTDSIRSILDEDEVTEINPNTIGVAQNGGRAPLIVSEAGFYKLVLRSRKPGTRPGRTDCSSSFGRTATLARAARTGTFHYSVMWIAACSA